MDTNTDATAAARAGPWLSLWLRPRATMRRILDSGSRRAVLPLAAVGGVSWALDRAVLVSLGDRLPFSRVLALVLVGGSLRGVLSVFVHGLLLRWTGRLLGARGSSADLRAALAWPEVLTLWGLLAWIPLLAFAGEECFTSETPGLDSDLGLMLLFLGVLLVELITGIWSVVVLLKCVGEAQGFSAWKALLNVLLASLVATPLYLAALVAALFAISRLI